MVPELIEMCEDYTYREHNSLINDEQFSNRQANASM